MISFPQVKAVVTDIEGTTSSISFVHDVLFPYARAHMADYVHAHEAELTGLMDDVRAEAGKPDLCTDDVIQTLISWIDEDRKATHLKTLQGMIWKTGFETAAFKGHIYQDAAEALKRWHGAGLKLYVYSSGSIGAQKLLYGYSEAGDLTPLFSGYFDTTTGHKREQASYEAIAAEIGLPANELLFLSDIVPELEAAKAAGFETVLLDREHAHDADIWPAKTDSFADIQPG